MPQAKLSPERGHTLCASLRSRNALQHFTRATLYGTIQEKCRAPEWAPWSSTGLYTLHLRKNPSVWTHCLGNKFMIHDTIPDHRIWDSFWFRFTAIAKYEARMPDGVAITHCFERARIDFGQLSSAQKTKTFKENMLQNIGKTRWFANSFKRFETVLHYVYFDSDNVTNSAERFGTVLRCLIMISINSVEPVWNGSTLFQHPLIRVWRANSLERFRRVLDYLKTNSQTAQNGLKRFYTVCAATYLSNSAERFGTVLHYLCRNGLERFYTIYATYSSNRAERLGTVLHYLCNIFFK